MLPQIESLSGQQIDEIIAAFNANDQLKGSYGFSGTKPTIYGTGVIPHLHRLGDRRYVLRDWKIVPDF
jgi:hypothetical protein